MEDEKYLELLEFISQPSMGRCTMNDLKDRFARGTKGSMLYYMTARLERAKLVKIRSDGVRNFLELTPTAQRLLGLTTEDR